MGEGRAKGRATFTMMAAADWPAVQCAAVRTHVGAMSVPPQKWKFWVV